MEGPIKLIVRHSRAGGNPVAGLDVAPEQLDGVRQLGTAAGAIGQAFDAGFHAAMLRGQERLVG
jgi:hypothetical protein